MGRCFDAGEELGEARRKIRSQCSSPNRKNADLRRSVAKSIRAKEHSEGFEACAKGWQQDRKECEETCVRSKAGTCEGWQQHNRQTGVEVEGESCVEIKAAGGNACEQTIYKNSTESSRYL